MVKNVCLVQLLYVLLQTFLIGKKQTYGYKMERLHPVLQA